MTDSTAQGADGESGENDESERARPTWRPRTILAAAAVIAVVIAATVWVTGDDAFELIDSERSADPAADDDISEAADASPDTCAVEAQPGSAVSAAPPVVRPTLSDRPILQWTQVDPLASRRGRAQRQTAGSAVGASRVSDFFTIEDGRVAVILENDGAFRLEVTSDGLAWEAFPLPSSIYPQEVHISDDSWVLVGRALNADGTRPYGVLFPRVLRSDDRGTTWTEVPIDPGTPPFFNDDYTGTFGLQLSADRMLLVSYIWPVPQFADLIADQGLIDSIGDVERWGLGTHSVTMWMPTGESGDDYSTVEIAYDELELSERQELLLDLWVAIVTSTDGRLGYVRTYAGDANGFSVTGDFDAGVASSVATRDGFMLSVGKDQESSRFFASTDGRDWSEIPVDLPIRAHFAGARDDGTMWAVIPGDGAFATIASFRCGQAPRTSVKLDGLIMGPPYDPGLMVGAGGMVAVARTEMPSKPAWIGWSTDGTDWDWQSAVDAFGFEPLETSIEIAVGAGFVLASVDDPFSVDPMWFVAEVPSRLR